MPENVEGVNFHKLVKGLSNGALSHLIEVASKESMNRNKQRHFPEFENKKLPVLNFTKATIIKIKGVEYKIKGYETRVVKDLETHTSSTWLQIDDAKYSIDCENFNFENEPIKIFLEAFVDKAVRTEALNSRSKVFWFYKLLENSVQDFFGRKILIQQSPYHSMGVPISNDRV